MSSDIYDYGALVERRIHDIDVMVKNEYNRQKLKEFAKYLKITGRSPASIYSNLMYYVNLGKYFKKPFNEVTKEDISEYLSQLEARGYRKSTFNSYKRLLKRFYKWLEGNEDFYPPKVKWIKAPVVYRNRLPKDLLTTEEVEKIVSACTNPRDKAFYSMLYESGCRIGELLNLKMKRISFDDHGAICMVTGKTGDRSIRLVWSVPYLRNWLEYRKHYAKEGENWVWVNIDYYYSGRKATYRNMHLRLKEIARRAGVVDKKVNFHSWRHARASELANDLTEAQMCAYFGWVQGSPMPRIYVHMNAKDLDDKILSMHGIVDKKELEPKLKVIVCKKCGETSPEAMGACMKCGTPLAVRGLLAQDREKAEIDALLEKLYEQPEVKNAIENALKRMKSSE